MKMWYTDTIKFYSAVKNNFQENGWPRKHIKSTDPNPGDKTNILSSYADSCLYIHMYISGNKAGYLYSHLY